LASGSRALKDLDLGKNDDGDDDCKVTSKNITGSTADVTVKCEDHTQTMHYEALSPESVRGTLKRTGGERPAEMTITGKWVAATCKE